MICVNIYNVNIITPYFSSNFNRLSSIIQLYDFIDYLNLKHLQNFTFAWLQFCRDEKSFAIYETLWNEKRNIDDCRCHITNHITSNYLLGFDNLKLLFSKGNRRVESQITISQETTLKLKQTRKWYICYHDRLIALISILQCVYDIRLF